VYTHGGGGGGGDGCCGCTPTPAGGGDVLFILSKVSTSMVVHPRAGGGEGSVFALAFDSIGPSARR
jgi:hypothetical protein